MQNDEADERNARVDFIGNAEADDKKSQYKHRRKPQYDINDII